MDPLDTIQTPAEETEYFKEEDGKILVPQQESDEPEDSPETSEPASPETPGEEDNPGQEKTDTSKEDDPEKDKDKTDQPEETEKETEEKPAETEEFTPERYKDLQTKLGEQGKELGELRKLVKASQDPEEIKKELTVEDTKTALEKENIKLGQMDPYDDEEGYRKQQSLVATLQTDYLEKKQEALIQQRFNDADNRKFLADIKTELKDTGIEVSDEEFDNLKESAKDYMEDGKYTRNAMYKALIDHHGSEKVQKFFTAAGEQKARKDITAADEKKDIKVKTNGSGKAGKYVALDDMTPYEMENYFDSLPSAELNRITEILDKRSN